MTNRPDARARTQEVCRARSNPPRVVSGKEDNIIRDTHAGRPSSGRLLRPYSNTWPSVDTHRHVEARDGHARAQRDKTIV